MREEDITHRISESFPDAVIEVAGEDCSFEVYVISDGFAGLNMLKRQQAILSLFNKEITSGELHALGVKAKTPSEQTSMAGLIQIES
jgi:BolA protein